jgi:hypothetical protein
MKEIAPSPELFLKIIKRLRREEQILAIKKVVLFSIIFSSSLAGLVSAGKALIAELQNSGAISFLSLIFSDFDLVKTYWQSFCLTVLQALPAISIALCLIILVVVLQSVKMIFKNIKIVSNIKNLATN